MLRNYNYFSFFVMFCRLAPLTCLSSEVTSETVNLVDVWPFRRIPRVGDRPIATPLPTLYNTTLKIGERTRHCLEWETDLQSLCSSDRKP
jgi:hypothetical protein